MNQNSQLLSILEGCLDPNFVQASQKQLVQYSNRPTFVTELLQLIPNVSNDIVIMIMSTIKNFCLEKYHNPISGQMSDKQKEILRSNLFNLYYIISGKAVQLYKEIVYIVVSIDFEKYTDFFYELLKEDLNSSIAASVYFCNQVARFYEWLNGEQRRPLERFVNDLFPKLEQLVEKIMTDYNTATRVLLTQLLEMFYKVFHIQVPLYLRNFNNLDKWLMYLRTIFKAPLDDYPDNHIQVSRIYVKIISMYCKDGTDGKQWKGWSQQFRKKHAMDLYTQVVQVLINPLANQDVMANILSCLCEVVKNPDLKGLMQEDHCQAIIYKHLLPFMESTNEDNAYFKNDSLEYIRRNQDLICHPYRRVALDLIALIAQKFNFGAKSQLMKFVQYAAKVLGDSYSTDKHKQVILISLVQITPLIFKNQYLRQNFQNLIQMYFIPLIKSSNQIIISQTLKLLAVSLKSINLSTNTIKQLMGLLYDKMCSDCLVIKYHGILAFTELLYDKEALESARPHFQNILSIYVKLLEVLDHEGLISSLESIVKYFSHEIASVASELTNHLFNLFYSLHNKQNQDNNQQQYEADGRQANAVLSTIKQILQAPLSQQQYYEISEKVMILVQNLCSDYDDYFEEILNVLNTLVYKSNNIVNFEFPYLLCRKLLEGDNQILQNCENRDFVNIISQAAIADNEYSQTLISITKNLIQKMPNNIFHKYPYSTNPQILLCMIQNKKLDQSALANLNTSKIDKQWSCILQSYTAVAYGCGQICDIRELKMLNGVSLYPWIEFKFDVEVIKRLMLTLEDQQAEDVYYEQNTVQMLENLANQNDDDDQDDYYVSDGGNYGYMYDSPYDSAKDTIHLVNKIKQLTANQFNYIFSQLPSKYMVKLETLLKQ